jgi:hypothetical protein
MLFFPGRTHVLTEAPSLKKRLNVDSPSFTPSLQSSPSLSVSELNTRSAGGMSMQAANAAPFRPDTYNAGKPCKRLSSLDCPICQRNG